MRKQLYVSLFCLYSLYGQPHGTDVMHGIVQWRQEVDGLTVTASNRAIVHWKEFSVGQGELLRFIQPSSTSAILNRVLEGNPSKLLGNLEANGQVFLVNPSGIVVGEGACINHQHQHRERIHPHARRQQHQCFSHHPKYGSGR